MGRTGKKAEAMTSATGPRTDRAPRGGFTLLELIAVLVLLSTVLAIAAPSLRGFARGRQTSDTAARMLALTRLAHSRAASWGCPHRLNFDQNAGEYWLTMQQGGAFVELDDDAGRRYTLPVGVSMELDLLSVSGRGAELYVEFHPDGRCDAAIIQLTGGQGEVYQITCPSPSEPFRIIRPEEKDRL